MKDKSKILAILLICSIIFITSLCCYSQLFIAGGMIQKDVKIGYSIYMKYATLCTVESTDSWGDYLRQDPELEVYTPPKDYTSTAIISVDNDKRWIIVYNHDIPHGSFVIWGEVVYNGTISRYSGIIKVKEMRFYSGFPLMLIKNRDIIRFVTFLIFIFWVSLVYISLSEWRRGGDENRKVNK